MRTLIALIVDSIYILLVCSVFIAYYVLEYYGDVVTNEAGNLNSTGYNIMYFSIIFSAVISIPISVFAYKNYDEILSRRARYTSSKVSLLASRIKYAIRILITSIITFILLIPSICILILSLFK